MTSGLAPRAVFRTGSGRVGAWVRGHRIETLFIGLGLLARVLFWQITDRKFEDGLITVTHARSAAEGIGLTHHPFEPVTHGFTSAVSVLVPLVGELLDFLPRFDGFLMLRLTSLVAFVATILAAARLADHLGLRAWPRVFLYGFLALSFNHVFYGMAGMETQIAVAVLLWAVVAGLERRVVVSGLLYGLCVLTRPDFALFVGLALLWWLVRDRRAALRVGALSALVVLPWVVFTTAYYGSPIPNTITTKSLRYPIGWPETLAPGDWWSFLATKVTEREGWVWKTLSPYWEHAFVTDAPVLQTFVTWFSGAIIVLAAAGLVALRRRTGWTPVVAFVALFIVYRLIALPNTYYDWYYPPLTALVVVLAAYSLNRIRVRRVPAAAAIVLCAAFGLALVPLIVLEERYQHEVENNARLPLGLWLRGNVPAGSVVTSESAGYVGYYAAGNVKLWDYPGLTSGEGHDILEALPERGLIEHYVDAARPDYAIWRPRELEFFKYSFGESAALYEEVARFKAPVDEARMTFGGVKYAIPDTEFVVMKRVRGKRGGVERARQLAGGSPG